MIDMCAFSHICIAHAQMHVLNRRKSISRTDQTTNKQKKNKHTREHLPYQRVYSSKTCCSRFAVCVESTIAFALWMLSMRKGDKQKDRAQVAKAPPPEQTCLDTAFRRNAPAQNYRIKAIALCADDTR